ncbi:PhoP regulatory network YrbL family protein [Candidatus Woesearchaeota archaeon]|nr:PhoP regulatory network YrbL family protein [Candidatus Woesearchaeota archaeon]MBW3005441.1 PhoP regulatory network YrbL family protein [Candidatus Woesearchaeota archaeon]
MTLELALPETELFLPENMIGQGAVREAYICGDFVLKVMKPNLHIRKKVFMGRVEIPAEQHLKKRYKIDDFNTYEFTQYLQLMQKVPAYLLNSFAKIIGVKEIQGRSVSINDLVRDTDGSISRTLADNGPIADEEFWERMGELEQFFLREEILHLGVDDRNILVRTTEEGTLPVIIDYKRMGKNVRPRTIGMLFAYGRAAKTRKKFQAMREKYKS